MAPTFSAESRIREYIRSPEFDITRVTSLAAGSQISSSSLRALAQLAHGEIATSRRADFYDRGDLNTLAVWLDFAADRALVLEKLSFTPSPGSPPDRFLDIICTASTVDVSMATQILSESTLDLTTLETLGRITLTARDRAGENNVARFRDLNSIAVWLDYAVDRAKAGRGVAHSSGHLSGTGEIAGRAL